jgi:hypothetical protein
MTAENRYPYLIRCVFSDIAISWRQGGGICGKCRHSRQLLFYNARDIQYSLLGLTAASTRLNKTFRGLAPSPSSGKTDYNVTFYRVRFTIVAVEMHKCNVFFPHDFIYGRIFEEILLKIKHLLRKSL